MHGGCAASGLVWPPGGTCTAWPGKGHMHRMRGRDMTELQGTGGHPAAGAGIPTRMVEGREAKGWGGGFEAVGGNRAAPSRPPWRFGRGLAVAAASLLVRRSGPALLSPLSRWGREGPHRRHGQFPPRRPGLTNRIRYPLPPLPARRDGRLLVPLRLPGEAWRSAEHSCFRRTSQLRVEGQEGRMYPVSPVVHRSEAGRSDQGLLISLAGAPLEYPGPGPTDCSLHATRQCSVFGGDMFEKVELSTRTQDSADL